MLCYNCHIDKPEEEFHKNIRASRGYQSNCKDCMKVYQKNYHRKDKPLQGYVFAEELLRFPLNG